MGTPPCAGDGQEAKGGTVGVPPPGTGGPPRERGEGGNFKPRPPVEISAHPEKGAGDGMEMERIAPCGP